MTRRKPPRQPRPRLQADPYRHPLGRQCAVMLLLAPLWPVYVAAYWLRRRWSQ